MLERMWGDRNTCVLLLCLRSSWGARAAPALGEQCVERHEATSAHAWDSGSTPCNRHMGPKGHVQGCPLRFCL